MSQGIHPTAYISPQAGIGEWVQVGAHAVLLEGCAIGEQTTIGPGTIIEKGVKIGDRCEIEGGCYLSEGTSIANDCHLFPGVVTVGEVNLRPWAVIGPRATLVDITVDREGVVVAGAVQTENVSSPNGAKKTGK